ncbi:alkaline phosphatase [Algoriphagus winogradskyi]|uniref:Alkaline phosphatase n=1 Tax=Algoriphagus winogradskyi TaxID=237017 RepID=A0ABY1NFZ7_9BACT|nr:alkaline phosphatase [Algoriphagus winogradskyi]SMP08575.1 alkaline phosphatase [Algoriphagus winogradskyi]
MNKFFSTQLLLLLLISFGLSAQNQAAFQIHSHNDYLQTVPFWTAYGAGATSIEVDLILQDGILMAAHEVESIDSRRTIESLYLDPIKEGLKNDIIPSINFHLLVDLKTEAYSTLEVLEQSMLNYQDVLFSESNPGGLKLIISGNRPKPDDYKNYPDWMLFDYQSKELSKDLPWDKIGMVSLSFRQFSIWNGKGRMVEEQRAKLQNFIDLVHSFGKPVRFWGSPDSKSAWKAFYEMGEDYINTDHPNEAADYLSKLTKNVYHNTSKHEVYQPTFELDGANVPVRNVILMIGDGNGLAQISAALFSNGNQLNLTQLKNLGLVKTQAADDFTTDSAAGATAYATGEKTNNRALGVDSEGKALSNLPDILDEYGFASGIITTDQLTGATPASFYAHHPERDDADQISAYLSKSKLDMFIAGGGTKFSSESKNLQDAGFTMVESLGETSAERIGYFVANDALPKKLEGRGEYLVESTAFGLNFLAKKNTPFFLMVEAANIDSGGHENNSSMIVSEMLDFDQAIAEVIQFADQNPGTLVIITADHETGGVSIPQGDIATGTVELAYHSDDHTGIMVPIFAYGAHSGDFRGIYENTEVFHKIMKLVKRYHSK